MTSPLTSLRERVEAAGGPDRELDRDIWEVAGFCAHRETMICETDADGFDMVCAKCRNDDFYVPMLTASIDAAVSLVEKVLPGWRIVMEFGENYSSVFFRQGWGARREKVLGASKAERADNEIALCACEALLRALEARERGE